MNYTDLVVQIQNYANKLDQAFLEAIPNFIEMGQQRIWRELTGIEFELNTVSNVLRKSNAYLIKPSDWNKTISIAYSNTVNSFFDFKILKPRTYEFCRAYWPNANNIDSNNPPEFYSDVYTNRIGQKDNYFFISPTPDQYYFYQLVYLKRIDAISKQAGINTNILTDNYPDLLFYACFLEALSYLRDDERIQIYEANYQRALQSAMQQTTDRHVDRTVNREAD